MRSRGQYIITKDEVHGYANQWLSWSLKLEYEGTKCTASTFHFTSTEISCRF